MRTPVRKLFVYRNTQNAVTINNSPLFTAFTAKRCRFIFFHRISYESSPPNFDPGLLDSMEKFLLFA